MNGLMGQLTQADEEAKRRAAQLQAMMRQGSAPIQEATPVFEAPAQQPQQSGIGQFLGNLYQNTLGDEEWRLRKAIALNSMRLNPDAALGATLGNRLENAQQIRAANAQANKTAEMFIKMGRPDLADAIKQNPGIASELVKSYYGQQFKSPSAFAEKVNALVESGVPKDKAISRVIQGSQQPGFSATFHPETGEFRVSQGGPGGDMTESESNASMFGTRMYTANKALESIESEGTKIGQAIAGKVPFVGNFWLSPEGRQYQNAVNNFASALLRKESGAVIGKDEVDQLIPIYFPVPGDDPQTIEMKRKNRQIVVNAMMQAGKTTVAGQDQQTVQPRSIRSQDGTIYEVVD